MGTGRTGPEESASSRDKCWWRRFSFKTLSSNFSFSKWELSIKCCWVSGSFYLFSREHKGWSIEFSILEEPRDNGIRRFGWAGLEELLLWRWRVVDNDRTVVASTPCGNKRKGIAVHGDCLVFWLELYLHAKIPIPSLKMPIINIIWPPSWREKMPDRCSVGSGPLSSHCRISSVRLRHIL